MCDLVAERVRFPHGTVRVAARRLHAGGAARRRRGAPPTPPAASNVALSLSISSCRMSQGHNTVRHNNLTPINPVLIWRKGVQVGIFWSSDIVVYNYAIKMYIKIGSQFRYL